MKLVFFGNHVYGYQSLLELIEQRYTPRLVVTNIPRADEVVWYPSVGELAMSRDIEVIRQNKINSREDVVARVEEISPDLLVLSSYRNLIPDKLLNIPPLGAINLHMAPLPKYRGAHPENWAIINGEKWMGYTVHYLDGGIDTGDIIAQDRVRILPEDDILSLTFKLSAVAPTLLVDALRDVETGHGVRTKQDESQASYFPPRKPSDGLIDWSLDDTQIHNLVRALTRPYPGAFTLLLGEKLTIWRTRLMVEELECSHPGQIVERSSDGFLIGTGSKPILITDHQWPGGQLSDSVVGEIVGNGSYE